jgi:glucose/mannose-6-phosphate isomerase
MTDSLNLLAALAAQPEQFAAAHEYIATADLTAVPAPETVSNIVIAGMGDSGIAADIVAAVTAPEVCVPVTVVKGYDCPAFVGPGTLVFVVSYSGDTEETLAFAAAACDAGATLVSVGSGGALAALAAARGGLHLACPASPTDRTTIMGFIPVLLGVFQRGGFWAGAHRALLAAEAQLIARRDACAPAVAGTANPARELARKLDRTFPLVYGGGVLGAAAAYRWKCAHTESAKAPAFWNAYPELDHNEIAGWGQDGDVTRQLLSIIELRHDGEHTGVAARFDATREIIRETVHQILEVRAEGDGPLAQLLDLVALGEWVSCYVALQNDVDPGPVPAVNDLKRALSHDRG